jgi:DNA repair protein RadC
MKLCDQVRIEMVKEKTVRYKEPITTGTRAAEVLKTVIGNTDRETAVVLCLDTKNKINAVNIVSIGTVRATLTHPREVFKAAILSNATGIIFAHNHPSGDTTPSEEDEAMIKRLIAAGDILGIPLLDSVILGDDNFYSFRESNCRLWVK